MTVVLGPVPCQGCREPVAYAPSCRCGIDSGDPHGSLRWTDTETGRAHRCPSRARAKWDNTGVGISDASSDNMCDALLVADTSREGVPRLEVSAP